MGWVWIGAGFLFTMYLLWDENRVKKQFISVPTIGSVRFPILMPVGTYPLAPTVTPEQYYGPAVGMVGSK